jgi:hypothetical protein
MKKGHSNRSIKKTEEHLGHKPMQYGYEDENSIKANQSNRSIKKT